MSAIASRVENRRSGFSLPVAVGVLSHWPASIRFGLTLFPVPAHRTGQADFPHPALGKDTRLIGRYESLTKPPRPLTYKFFCLDSLSGHADNRSTRFPHRFPAAWLAPLEYASVSRGGFGVSPRRNQ